jgi:N-acetylglucosaminyldiphosphoundecaprenol N-acetyl-beta-D-mannosaminyltransferase
VTEAQCVERLFSELAQGRGGRIATVNLDQLAIAARRADFHEFCASGSIVVADGMPIVWASRLQRTPLPARVTGADLFWSVSEAAASQDRSIFLVGGEPSAAERAARELGRRWPVLRIAGTICPDPASAPDRVDARPVKAALAAARPDIVMVGLPSVKTQHLMQECTPVLPAAWWIGVGVGFSYAAGLLARAPRWQQQAGLEWLHRLSTQRGLAYRYLARDPRALARLLITATRRRWSR